jgi:hypothetical protein
MSEQVEIKPIQTEEVRQRVARTYPGASVWLAATHTHSAPDRQGSFSLAPDPNSPAITARVISGASSAAEEAIARLHVVRANRVSGEINGIATNRDHPHKRAVISIDLLCFYNNSEQTKPVALFGSFPCHPTILGATNLALSADLPGAYRRQLQALLGQETWIALATGAAGDISTRHTRQGQGFDELERLGALLAKQAYTLLSSAQPLKLDLPHVSNTVVALERKKPFSPGQLAAYTHVVQERMRAEQQAGNMAQVRTLETALQGLQAAQKEEPVQAEQVRNVAVSAAIAGDLALVAVPGELYNTLGVQIKREAGRFVLLLGYTNGYAGYIPDREAYAELDYEIVISPFAPGSGEQLVHAIEMLLMH